MWPSSLSCPRKRPRSPRRSRPAIEVLEHRCLLAGTFPGVPDVEAQFVALKHHGEALGWYLPEEPAVPNPSWFDHYEGLARYPGTGTPVVYLTQRDADDNDPQGGTTGGYLEVVRLGSRDTDGERLRSNLQANTQFELATTANTLPPAEDTWVSAIRFNGRGVVVDGQTLEAYEHPGGMAIADNILFVALDSPANEDSPNQGMIVLFDLGQSGEWREAPRPLKALPLGHAIDNLAVVKRSEATPGAGESYLIWTNGDGGKVTRFYRTRVTEEDPTVSHLRNATLQLELVQDWNPGSPDNFDPGAIFWPTGFGAHQSSTFISQWDGEAPPVEAPLYLIGMRHFGVPQPVVGLDFADLYRVTDNGLGGFKLTLVQTLHMFCDYTGAGRIGNFAAGSTAYVSPSGELILYSAPHDDENRTDPDYIKMAEFRHRDGNRPDSPLRLPTADAGGPYSVPEAGSLTLHGTGAVSADRPWVELFDDNNGWLHDFERTDLFPSLHIDRSIVVDYEDRDLFELNNFTYLDFFDHKTSSVRWRLPVGLDVELFEEPEFRGDRKITLTGTGATEQIRDLGDDRFDFNDATMSMRFVGSVPGPSSLTFEWDLDGDGVFGETGSGAARGDETTATPTFSAAGLDGPGTFTVRLRVRDQNGGVSAPSTATIHLTNAPPTIISLTSSNPDLTHASPDGVVRVGGTYADPAGPLDTHTVTVNWGDGTPVEVLPASAVDQAGDAFARGHTYATGGIFTVTVTVADEDGGVSAARTVRAVVSGVGVVDRVLYVIGTDGRDDVLVKDRDRGARLLVEAKLGNGRTITADFPAAAVDHLVIYLGGGDDQAQLQNKVTIDALLLGGEGADQLYGGGGHNVLAGGAGDDHLIGGDLADILIGGAGEDRLQGKGGSDVLIGGFTDRDDDLEALLAALAAWKARDLSGVASALTAIRDDGVEDALEGGLDGDQLFGGIGDRLKE
jgi:Ca2+-binding RTX toxin-like protein